MRWTAAIVCGERGTVGMGGVEVYAVWVFVESGVLLCAGGDSVLWLACGWEFGVMLIIVAQSHTVFFMPSLLIGLSARAAAISRVSSSTNYTKGERATGKYLEYSWGVECCLAS